MESEELGVRGEVWGVRRVRGEGRGVESEE